MLKPRRTATREMFDLDGMWRFALDCADVPKPWSSTLHTTLEAPVPASYNDVFVDRTIRDHVGWVWYQRTVQVPRGWAGERIFVRLDSATHEGRVYVDDALVAEHVGGYLPFEADITEHAAPGAEIRLTIGVNNELTNATIPPGLLETTQDGRRRQVYFHDFYNYAGLARSVWLYSAPATRIVDIAATTRVVGDDGLVTYQVALTGEADVRVVLRDARGVEVAAGTGAAGTLRVQDVCLWQPGQAYLYELAVEAVADGAVVDAYPVAVGVRTVEVRGAEFLINGTPFYFTGFGKHEDTPVRGKGHDDAYLAHDFQLLDWMGANSFRTSHYPYAEEVLEFADRHGIVVIDETPAVGLNLSISGGITGRAPEPTWSPTMMNDSTREAHAREIRELIARDRNHPSVVMWCIANEPASNEEGAREYFEPLVELTRELDPTRPLTYANVMLAPVGKCRIADLFDVISLNRYYGWYTAPGDLVTAEQLLGDELRGWTEAYGKPIIMTEYGADTMPGVHSIHGQPWSEEYQIEMLEVYHRVFDRIPAVVGEQVWNFADFQTSRGYFRVDGNKKGVFTRDRRPKAVAHELRKRWIAKLAELAIQQKEG